MISLGRQIRTIKLNLYNYYVLWTKNDSYFVRLIIIKLMKKINALFLIPVIVLLSTVFIGYNVKAQTTSPYGNRDMSAPINLNDAYNLPEVHAVNLVFKKNDNTIAGSFNALNSEKETIGGLQYNIEILDANQNLYGIHPVRDQFMLASEEKKTINFAYVLPALPSGQYILRIQIVTNSGRLLGWDDYPLQINNGVNSFVNVSAVSIYIPEFKNQVLAPESGPNVSASENFSLRANITNIGSSQITVVPNLDMYPFEIAKGNGVSVKQSSITLNAGEKKSFDFNITAEKLPGVYSALFYFTDSNGNNISSIGKYHWVVKGASADILPLRISHLATLKGDQTVMNLDFVGAPDAETITQGNVDVQIIDAKGIAGEAKTSDIKLTDTVVQSIARVNLNRDLSTNPKINTVITDDKGNVLASSSINIEIPNQISINQNGSFNKYATPIIAFIALAILLCLAFALINMKRRINFKKVALFSVVLVTGLCLFAGYKVSAATNTNTNGIEILNPASSTVDHNLQGGYLVQLFINSPISDSPAGTYQKNAVPLEYTVTYAVCNNTLNTIRVNARYDLSGGKQTTFQGTNASWQILPYQGTFSTQKCADGSSACFNSSQDSATLNLSQLSSSMCSTTLQIIGRSTWGAAPVVNPATDFTSQDPSIANAHADAVNLYLNFPCNGSCVTNADCTSPNVCNSGKCGPACTQNVSQKCVGSSVYNFDSCGTQGSLVQNCSNGCNSNTNQCNTISTSVSPNPANINQLVTFTSTVTNNDPNATYSWSGACTGFYSSCQTSFTSAGTYTAYLTVTSNSQSQTVSVPVTVIASISPLNLSVYDTPNPAVPGQQIQFTAAATGGNGAYNYSWSGACTGTQSTCQNSFFLPGNYVAYLTVTSGSQTATSSVNANVAQTVTPLNISCSALPNSVNIGVPVTFSPSATGGAGNYTYSWSGACTSNQQNCANSFASAGIKTASLTVASGTQSQTTKCSVTVNDPSCLSNASQKCVNNSVYNFDSCGNQGSLVQQCSSNQTCSNGACVANAPTCTANASQRCVGNAIYYFDSCGNQGTIYHTCSSNQTCSGGACVINPPSCTANASQQCVGNAIYNFDSCGNQGSIYKNCLSSQTCSNGTCVSSCTANVSQQCVGNSIYYFDSCGNQGTIYKTCNSNQTCSNGACVANTPTCTANASQQCVGNAVYNFDSCGNQGSLVQQCSSNQTCSNGTCVNQIQNVACSSNSDCGVNSFAGANFCQSGSVYKNYQLNVCNNPGTSQSYCSTSTTPIYWYGCASNQTCSGGYCINQSQTQNVACSSNSDCGTSCFSGSTFCQSGGVYKNYQLNVCNNPGTSQSYCSTSTTPILWYGCASNQTCSGGYCFN